MAGYAAATASGGKNGDGRLVDDRQAVGAGPEDDKADNEAGQGFHGECSLLLEAVSGRNRGPYRR